MKRFTLALLAAALLCSAGCAKKVTKMWEAAGGSRADATVEVGYTYNPQNELPEANELQALQEARKRCQAWGYQEAEPFGLIKSNCQQMVFQPFAGMACTSMLVTKQFQCLGRGDMATPLEQESGKGKRVTP